MGDREGAWRAWIEGLAPALGLLARQWTDSHADAEDVVQEALMRFWRSGRHRARDPKAYLFACVRRAALDLKRSTRRRQHRERAAGQAPSSEAMFDTAPERNEWRAAVESAISTLSIEQREVLVMKTWGDLTFDQIGRVLDIPRRTAASRYRYALGNLRGKLKGGYAP